MQSVSAMAGENNIYFQIEYFIVCATRDPQSHSIIVSVLAADCLSCLGESHNSHKYLYRDYML